MTRTVFDNFTVAHIWAQQNQASGRSHNGNFYFEGSAIYSYYTCIGMFLKPYGSKAGDSPLVFLSDTNHSVSTSKVQGYLSVACRHRNIVYVSSALLDTMSSRPWIFKSHEKSSTESEKKLRRAHCKAAIQKQADSWFDAARRELKAASRARSRKVDFISAARDYIARANDLAAMFRVRIKTPKHLRQIDSDLDSVLETLQAQEKQARDKARAAQAKRLEAAKARDKAAFEEWERGISPYACPASYDTTPNGGVYMRRYYKPDGESELQTSQGARVPWTHAVRVFQALKAVRASGAAWESNGRVLRVGHFSVDRIEANGDFRAGCHAFKWADIEPFALAQGVFGIEASDSAIVSKESV